MIDFTASGDELLALGAKLKLIRHVNGEARCSKCIEPIAWVIADPRTLAIYYCEPSTPDARPLTLCRGHREIESGRIEAYRGGVRGDI